MKDENGLTPLILACQNGHKISVVKLLAQTGIDINFEDKENNVALMFAAENGSETIIDMLLKRREICLDSKNKEDETPLIIASKNNKWKIVIKLLMKAADGNFINEKLETPLIIAAHSGIDTLMKKNNLFIVNKKNISYVLLAAAKNGYEEVVIKLLKSGISVNFRDENDHTPLICASRNGYLPVVKRLLKAEAIVHINIKNCKLALIEAIRFNHIQIAVELLLHTLLYENNFKNTRKNNKYCLLFAIRTGYTEIVNELLTILGNDIECKDEKGRNILSLACKLGHEDIVDLLLMKGIKVNKFNNTENGYTPLMYATKASYESIVIKLLEHGYCKG